MGPPKIDTTRKKSVAHHGRLARHLDEHFGSIRKTVGHE
jgi:hypothetical protein